MSGDAASYESNDSLNNTANHLTAGVSEKKKRPLSFEDEKRLQMIAAAVAAAGPSSSSTKKNKQDQEERNCNEGAPTEEPSSSSGLLDHNDSVDATSAPQEEEDPITGKIDSVDVYARMAMLDKLKSDMMVNFMKMKRAYGGPPSRKKQQSPPPQPPPNDETLAGSQ
ncbi:Hypothetical protein, putative [Bodo saltans]|uniref:Uncharacterized protein n=1 Tax=Bodo saltans TaxID=75058 RepID=A0A0S4JQI0_BODSA|nr:Hypothetical protein, putative [Bodo saltans]|eukprot:CUG92225.1 Hypothetical protein, putative [Bodo saltans]